MNRIIRNSSLKLILRNWSMLSFLTSISTFALVGCQSNSGTPDVSSTGNPSAAKSSLKVGVVFDSGGLGDKSFNDSANAGLLKAEKELGVQAKTVQSASEKDYVNNITAMADQGSQLIFAVGLNQADALKEVAPKYPKVNFAIIDGTVDAPNVRSLHFSEEQGSFLAGYLAGLVSKTNSVGFVGGQELDLIKKFYCGYAAGAKTANPRINVLPAKYVGDWDNVDNAHAEALQLFGEGADIVYHAAGRAGLGVINAAKEQGKFAIGVDSNQDAIAPGSVLTSMIKRVDQSVFQTISDDNLGKFTPGTKVYDLKSDGVGLSDFAFTKDKIGVANIAKLDKVKQEIISGKIVVPTTEAELTEFLSKIK